MKRQQETYLTKFLYRIQTLFLCQKHTAVGLTWQTHLLCAPHYICLTEAESGRCVLCWRHADTTAMELRFAIFPLHCHLSIWAELSQECYMHKMVQTMWAKHNCWKQANVCTFMLEFADFNWVWDHYTYRKDGNTQNRSIEMSVSTWWTVKSSLTQNRCPCCHFYSSIAFMNVTEIKWHFILICSNCPEESHWFVLPPKRTNETEEGTAFDRKSRIPP